MTTPSAATAALPTATPLKTILPLAAITCASMLAMDLYLPAVPALQQDLGLTVPQGQATIAVFLAGLAASQLLWGEAVPRIGPKACVRWGLVLLIVASFGCALAQGIDALLAWRLLQGMAAGASTVVAPTVIRATLPPEDGVRGMAAIAMIEAIIPAAGPIFGTVLLTVADWRWSFALVGAMALLAAPLALRAAPKTLPNLVGAPRAPHEEGGTTQTPRSQDGYLALLRNTRFVRLALAHALCFAALLTLVASAPQVLRHELQAGLPAVLQSGPQEGSRAFATLQFFGVATFIGMASRAGRLSARWGQARCVQGGAWAHAVCCVALAITTAAGGLSFVTLTLFWMAFCGILGVRGPAAFSDALSVPVAQMGRAAGLLVLALLVVSAASAQAVAPFLAEAGMRAVAGAMALLCVGSLLLVRRYPHAPLASREVC